MAEATYVTPEDGNGAGSVPTSAGEGQQAARTETETLEEMNAKLDAILAALGRREA